MRRRDLGGNALGATHWGAPLSRKPSLSGKSCQPRCRLAGAGAFNIGRAMAYRYLQTAFAQ